MIALIFLRLHFDALFFNEIAFLFLLISTPRVILRKKALEYHVKKINIS